MVVDEDDELAGPRSAGRAKQVEQAPEVDRIARLAGRRLARNGSCKECKALKHERRRFGWI